jgi:hypothetical protein
VIPPLSGSKGISVTPKNGKARKIAMPASLVSTLFDLAGQRRREGLAQSWHEVPAWVFCSKAGTPLEERNLSRSWYRVRRWAQKVGVRPLKLHAARHTFASMALAAGKSIRWVAEQLGHANPELTMRVYAHAMPTEEGDLTFADFRAGDGAKRLYPAPALDSGAQNENAPAASQRRRYRILERETGVEPATLSLGSYLGIYRFSRDSKGLSDRRSGKP